MLTLLKHSDLIDIGPDDHHKRKHHFESLDDHAGLLPERLIQYSNPPAHSHKTDHKIKVQKEGEKETKYRPLIEFRAQGTIDIDVFDNASKDKVEITFTGNSSAGTPVTGTTYAMKDYLYFTHAGTGPYEELYYPINAVTAARISPGSKTISVNTLYAIPVVFPRGGTLDKILFYVRTSVASSNMRIGIYDRTSAGNQYPANLIIDAGTVSTATQGLKSVSFSQAVTAGTQYYVAFVESHGGVAIQVAPQTNQFPEILGMIYTTSPGARFGTNLFYNVSFGYAALSASFPGGASLTNTWTASALQSQFEFAVHWSA